MENDCRARSRHSLALEIMTRFALGPHGSRFWIAALGFASKHGRLTRSSSDRNDDGPSR